MYAKKGYLKVSDIPTMGIFWQSREITSEGAKK